MSILLESCNEYLYEGVMNSIPLCEADESGDKKSLWQKVKDFFKRIWQWIKDKVMALFGKKKKSDEEKLKELKELLKDSTKSNGGDFQDFMNNAADIMRTCEDAMDKFYKKLSSNANSEKIGMDLIIEDFKKILEEPIKETDDMVMTSINDVIWFENNLKSMEKTLKKIEDFIKKVSNSNSEVLAENVESAKEFGNLLLSCVQRILTTMKSTIIDKSIAKAKEAKSE